LTVARIQSEPGWDSHTHCLLPEALITGYEPHDRGNRVHGMSLSALAVQRLSNLAKSIIRLCFGAVLGTLLCFLNTQARHRLLPVGQMNNNVEAAIRKSND
ncbi:hypothetical protein, partial [Pseudomonas savastanoi]|uniref:hypothetical protein n=1 Tax=Pseudomonas savastanoi TaxID=29438 RepID=UPI000F3C817E